MSLMSCGRTAARERCGQMHVTEHAIRHAGELCYIPDFSRCAPAVTELLPELFCASFDFARRDIHRFYRHIDDALEAVRAALVASRKSGERAGGGAAVAS
jgi:hypothetical protein